MDNAAYAETLHRLLTEINLQMASAFRLTFAPMDLTKSQGLVVRILQEGGSRGVALGELCAAMQTPASNATNICNRLESMGLIEKCRSDCDRRTVRLRLTARGGEVAARLRTLHAHMIGTLVDLLNPTDQTQILQALQTLRDAAATVTEKLRKESV